MNTTTATNNINNSFCYYCEYPRCNDKALYTFVDDISTPRFCSQHKCPGMILANGIERPLLLGGEGATTYNTTRVASVDEQQTTIPIIPAVPIPTTNPHTHESQAGAGGSPNNNIINEASIELAYQYFALKPEYESLETAQRDATVHRQQKLDPQKTKLGQEIGQLQTTTQSIEKLQRDIEKQENKILDCFGKSIFGMGLLMKDQKVIDRKRNQLQADHQRKQELEFAKSKDENLLAELQSEQKRLDEMVEIRMALESRIQQLRTQCLQKESTLTLRSLEANHQLHQRMQQSLQWCRKDVATAHKLFQQALQTQAVAARSNAMAAGANIGQAIGGGGGRGIGQSPGERLLQIRRNQATKRSIELARQAADTLNTAQDRLANELRVHFATEMNGVGIIEVPDLWHGRFFRDFLVGQAAGNIGDAINQGRAMIKIRKNMETLEQIIGACTKQEQQLLVVHTKLETTTNMLRDQVDAEEKRILNIVLEVAKYKQQQQQHQERVVGTQQKHQQQQQQSLAQWQQHHGHGTSFKLSVY